MPTTGLLCCCNHMCKLHGIDIALAHWAYTCTSQSSLDIPCNWLIYNRQHCVRPSTVLASSHSREILHRARRTRTRKTSLDSPFGASSFDRNLSLPTYATMNNDRHRCGFKQTRIGRQGIVIKHSNSAIQRKMLRKTEYSKRYVINKKYQRKDYIGTSNKIYHTCNSKLSSRIFFLMIGQYY